MSTTRNVETISQSVPTLEGAGVHLKRVFGFQRTPKLDPFLLLDDFHSDQPEHYLRGFPWHPHRGIETITYILEGQIEHGDSLGHQGTIESGDVQWMTAGSGIIHQEMPHGNEAGVLWGFQLWANLPAANKMMPPRYRDVLKSQIPEIAASEGVTLRLICGAFGGVQGPVQDIVTDPTYWDVSLAPKAQFAPQFPAGHTVFAYVIEGQGTFDRQVKPISAGHLVVFGDGDELAIAAQGEGMRFLLISGRPLNEPVAWYGPIVMNTDEELQVAFDEYRNGTFLKHAL